MKDRRNGVKCCKHFRILESDFRPIEESGGGIIKKCQMGTPCNTSF